MDLEISGGEGVKVSVSWKQIRSVYKKEYMQWIKNPKMIVVAVLLVMIREIVVLPMAAMADWMNQPLNVLEPVIAVANSGMILLLLPLVYLVIIADFPTVDGNTYYYLPRVGRMNWLLGQLMFQAATLLTYILFIILSTGVQVCADSFLINGWSLVTTNRTGMFSGTVMETLLPLNLYYQMSPYRAFAMSYVMMFLFLALCSGIMLLASMYGKKTVAFWAIMLSVAVGIVFCAIRSKWMWLFPVSHSIVWLHYQDYYRSYVFSPWLSILLFIILNVMVFAAVLYKGRRVNLDILREGHE